MDNDLHFPRCPRCGGRFPSSVVAEALLPASQKCTCGWPVMQKKPVAVQVDLSGGDADEVAAQKQREESVRRMAALGRRLRRIVDAELYPLLTAIDDPPAEAEEESSDETSECTHEHLDHVVESLGVLDHCPKGCGGEGEPYGTIEVFCVDCGKILYVCDFGGHDEDCRYG